MPEAALDDWATVCRERWDGDLRVRPPVVVVAAVRAFAYSHGVSVNRAAVMLIYEGLRADIQSGGKA